MGSLPCQWFQSSVPLCFELQGFVFPPATAEKIGKRRPGPRNAGGVPEIILRIRVPRHKLVQELLVGFDCFGGLVGLGIVVGLGSKSIVDIAHGLDFVCWVSAGLVQQFESWAMRCLASSSRPSHRAG